jgi:glyoxylase I family protein
MPSFSAVSHVELTVRDVDRSKAWYRDVLGFDVVLAETDHPDFFQGRVVSVLREDADTVIGLVQHQHGEPGRFSEFRVGLDHLSFSVDTQDELEAWLTHFEERGVEHTAIIDMPYASVVVFRDPDNIQLELFCVPARPS